MREAVKDVVCDGDGEVCVLLCTGQCVDGIDPSGRCAVGDDGGNDHSRESSRLRVIEIERWRVGGHKNLPRKVPSRGSLPTTAALSAQSFHPNRDSRSEERHPTSGGLLAQVARRGRPLPVAHSGDGHDLLTGTRPALGMVCRARLGTVPRRTSDRMCNGTALRRPRERSGAIDSSKPSRGFASRGTFGGVAQGSGIRDGLVCRWP